MKGVDEIVSYNNLESVRFTIFPYYDGYKCIIMPQAFYRYFYRTELLNTFEKQVFR